MKLKFILQDPIVVGETVHRVRIDAKPIRWALAALPRECWQPIPGGCCCPHCARPDGSMGPAFWDSIVLADIDRLLEDGELVATMCHAPDLHPRDAAVDRWTP